MSTSEPTSASVMNGLGQALRWLRDRQSKKQYQVAESAGITKGMLSAYETGRQRPSLETLEKILTTLGCDLNDLHNAIQIINGRPERIKQRGEGVGEEPETAAKPDGGGADGGPEGPRPARSPAARGGEGVRRDAGRLPSPPPLLPRDASPRPAGRPSRRGTGRTSKAPLAQPASRWPCSTVTACPPS